MNKNARPSAIKRKPPHNFDDNPIWTREDFRRARPASEVVPRIVAAKRGPGRPPLEKPKVALTLRLDPDMIACFRATGEGWQRRMNEALVRAAKKLQVS
jgi:uncharacterized protein (DUF4415 family)